MWHDFADDDGGGVLDLIVRVRGGTRAEALRWLGDFIGIPLDDQPLSPAQRADWRRQQRELERVLPDARLWRCAVVKLTDELLDVLKGALIDPTLPWPKPGEIYRVTQLLSRLERIDRAELAEECSWWATRYPGMTAALIRAARERERAERRALVEYLRLTDPREATR